MGWSAKEFFRGILIYLPPKSGRTPKSVTSSSKHSFWPTSTNGVEGDLRRSAAKTLTLLLQWFTETWVKLIWRDALLSHIGHSFHLPLPVLAFERGRWCCPDQLNRGHNSYNRAFHCSSRVYLELEPFDVLVCLPWQEFEWREIMFPRIFWKTQSRQIGGGIHTLLKCLLRTIQVNRLCRCGNIVGMSS